MSNNNNSIPYSVQPFSYPRSVVADSITTNSISCPILSTTTASITVNDDMVFSAGNYLFSERFIIAPTATELGIMANTVINSSINLQTRITGSTVNNLYISGNTMTSNRNGAAYVLTILPSANVASDRRLKHDRKVITDGLFKIRQLSGQQYKKTIEMYEDGQDVSGQWWLEDGFIAQEVLETDLSYCVNVPDNSSLEPMSINYNNLLVNAIQSIKELDGIVQQQARDIEELKDIVTNLLGNI